MPIDSRRSEDEPIVIAGAAATGAASIFTSALVECALGALATAATGATAGELLLGYRPPQVRTRHRC